MTHTGHNHVATHCAVCGADLSDSLSVQRGVGPTCWKHVNRAMESGVLDPHWERAETLCTQMQSDLWPDEARGRLTRVRDDVTRMARLGHYTLTALKAVIDELRWLSCWNVQGQVHVVTDLVSALGYVSLAGLLAGDAATGRTNVYAKAGRLYLQGPRCTAGNRALKQVPGRRAHPREQGGFAWSVPTNQAHAFRDIVMRYWPNTTVDLAEVSAWGQILDQLNGPTAELGKAVLAGSDRMDHATRAVVGDLALKSGVDLNRPVAAEPSASVARTSIDNWHGSRRIPKGGVLAVRTPYNADLVQQLKTLPRAHRTWNPSQRFWVVSAAHAERVVAMVREHYPNVEVTL